MYINQELNFSRVSKVREFTLYPTLIFPADKAPDRIGAVPTPLHSEGGGGVCCCSRSTSSCCRRRPCRSAALPLPLSVSPPMLLLQTVCCGQTYSGQKYKSIAAKVVSIWHWNCFTHNKYLNAVKGKICYSTDSAPTNLIGKASKEFRTYT